MNVRGTIVCQFTNYDNMSPTLDSSITYSKLRVNPCVTPGLVVVMLIA